VAYGRVKLCGKQGVFMATCQHSDSIRRRNYTLTDGTQKVQKQCKTCGDYFSEFDHRGKPKIFYVDIETSTMIFRAFSPKNDYIPHRNMIKDWFVISWAGQWVGDNKIISDVVTPSEALERDDRRISLSLWEIFNKADILVAHNGDRFDIKKMNYRFCFAHNLAPPLPYRSIDTLKNMRSSFSASYNALDFLAGHGMKIPAKLKTGFELWVACENGDQEALSMMDLYCRNDIKIGLALYNKTAPWVKGGVNLALYGDLKDQSCPRCGEVIVENDKIATTGANAFTTYRCVSCGHTGRTKNSILEKEQRRNLVS